MMQFITQQLHMNPVYFFWAMYLFISVGIGIWLAFRFPPTNLLSSDDTTVHIHKSLACRMIMPVFCGPLIAAGFMLLSHNDWFGLLIIGVPGALSSYAFQPYEVVADRVQRVCRVTSGWPWSHRTRQFSFEDFDGIYVTKTSFGLRQKYAKEGIVLDILDTQAETQTKAKHISELLGFPIVENSLAKRCVG